MKKIGFLFFDGLHIIHHFIGVAVALDKDPNIEVTIITYEGRHEYLYDLLDLLNHTKIIVKKLPTYNYRKIIESINKRKQPSNKYLLEKHKQFLLAFDILVFNDLNHEYLYNFKKHKKPKFILLMHGAGDGEYMLKESYQNKIEKFDLITTSGQKIAEFFKAMGNLPNTKIKICGYQKFDITSIELKNNNFFTNKKTTILYNPHFKKSLSSWYVYGNEILDFFYNNNQYNLIFAPHINLFNKKGFLNKNIIDKKYYNQSNILIDLGSEKSVNMSYTSAADLYLGDVSSQVYEFLIKPRPCLFINTHSVEWKNNKHYQNWSLGEVITNIDNLDSLLQDRNIWQKKFLQRQKEAIKYTFYKPKKYSATGKVVKAIKNLC